MEALRREVKEEAGIDIKQREKLQLVINGDTDEVARENEDGTKSLCHISFFTYKVQLAMNSTEYNLDDTEELST